MRVRAQFLVAPLGLLFCCCALAQIGGFEGDVKGADGKPMLNAIVRISREDAKRTYQSKTDKKGHYFYNGVPFGYYTILVQVDGKEIAGVNGVRAQRNDPVTVDFDLRITPQEQENRIKLEFKKAGLEWSTIRIMQIPAAVPAESPKKE
jgi:hypothetical protein